MAIGFDPNLRSTQPSPLVKPKGPAAPQKGSPYRPFAINDNAVADYQNNQRAAGVGAGRAALSATDRAGVSRGRGQQYVANMAEAAATSEATASADKAGMSAGIANANAQRSYDNTLASERLTNSGLLEGLRNTSAMERLSARDRAMNIQEAIRRGQFGLDQQQLDYSPLIGNLFQ